MKSIRPSEQPRCVAGREQDVAAPWDRSPVIAAWTWVWPVLALGVLIFLKPAIGGVDHLYYLLNARDMMDGVPQPDARFAYFPGVYAFWKLVLHVADGDYSSLQWLYLGLLALNGLVLGWLVRSVTALHADGLIAAALYWFYCPVLEGMHGVAEPIGTLPILLGLLAALRFPVGSLQRHVLLGLGLGAGVFVKQQLGLVSLGVASSLLLAVRGRASSWAAWSQGLRGISVAAITAFATLLVLTVVTTGSPGVLLQGLKSVDDYGSSGTWLGNLLGMLRAMLPLSLAAVLAAVMTVCGLRKPGAASKVLWLSTFCLIAVLVSFVQYWKRHYLHYGMIPLPFLVAMIVVTLPAASAGLSRALAWIHPRLWVGEAWSWRVYTFGLLGASLLFSGWTAYSLHRHGPFSDALSRYASLCGLLPKGSDVFVFPAIYNQVHWTCGTRSMAFPQGYSWARIDRGEIERTLSAPGLGAVVLMKEESTGNWDRSSADAEFSVEDLVARLEAMEPERQPQRIDTPLAAVFRFPAVAGGN